jgi:hypothetical protein
MKVTSIIGGIMLILLYSALGYHYDFNELTMIVLLPIIILGAFLLITGSRTKSEKTIKKKSDQSIFEGVLKIGTQKIRRGDLTINEDTFLVIMTKLKRFILDQSEVPEYGFNSLYLKFKNESEADDAMEKITNLGIKCKTMQDRGKYYITIEF